MRGHPLLRPVDRTEVLLGRLTALALAAVAVPVGITARQQADRVPGWWTLAAVLALVAVFALGAAGRARPAAAAMWLTTVAGALTLPLVVLAPYDGPPWLGQLAPLTVGVTVLLSRRTWVVAAAAVLVLVVGGVARSQVLADPGTGAVATFVGIVGAWACALAVVRTLQFGQRRLDQLRSAAVEDFVAARAEEATVRAEQDWDAFLHDEVVAAMSAIAGGPTAEAREQARRLMAESWAVSTIDPPSPWVGTGALESVLRLRPDAETDVVVDPGAAALPEPVRRAVLEALNELVRNVGRHAYADGSGPCRVVVRVDGAGVRVAVEDRGRGFDPHAVPESRLGLALSVQARMDAVCGWSDIASAPGRGTRVEVGWRRPAQAPR